MGEKDPNMQFEVNPVMPEDLPPPPSYEEVLGQFMTSVQHGQSSIPSLAYIDIMPRLLDPGNIKEKMAPTFQTFDDLVTGANVWLKDNPGLSVWKCETVERKVNSGANSGTIFIDLESMVQHEATFGFNCFVFGLRLWLTPKPDNQKGVQQLGMINVLPVPKEIDVRVSYNAFGCHHGFNSGAFSISQNRTMASYEGVKKSLEAFNKRTKEKPLPGTVLNIESTTLKFAEGQKQTSMEETASAAMWFELDGQSSKRYTQIMRIFYVKGSPTTPEICIEEFLPKQLNQPRNGAQSIRFDTFSSVIKQAASWLQQQSGIQIANIETREGEVSRIFNEIQIDTDTADRFEFGLRTSKKLKMLRVFYMSKPATPTFAHTALTTRLFTPVPVGGTKFETMTQTMTRIDAWMKMTGLPIFGVETVSFLRDNLSTIGKERCDFDLRPFSAKYWVNAIRVYFPSKFDEPSPNPFPSQNASKESSSCNII